MNKPDQSCYGCVRDVQVYWQGNSYKLKTSTILTLQCIERFKDIEFGLTRSGRRDYCLNIYGPHLDSHFFQVERRLAESKVRLDLPLTMRPGVLLASVQTNRTSHVKRKDDIQSWTWSDLDQMMKEKRQVDDTFHQFKRLPFELRHIVTSYFARREMVGFLATHKGAVEDTTFAYVRNSEIWSLFFETFTWLDQKSSEGFLPALIGDPSPVGEKIHLALVLAKQPRILDWERDRKELIETLRSQEGNGFTAVSEKGSLHIGQPFGKTDLQQSPNFSDKLISSSQKGTFMLYYEPEKFGPHPATPLYSTTASTHVREFAPRMYCLDSIEVQDAKQPGLTWKFLLWDPGRSRIPAAGHAESPLLPGGRCRTT